MGTHSFEGMRGLLRPPLPKKAIRLYSFLLASKFCLQDSVQCQGTEVDSALESVDWGKNSILTKAGRQHLICWGSEWKTKLTRIGSCGSGGQEGLWSSVCEFRTRKAGGVVQTEWSPGILWSRGEEVGWGVAVSSSPHPKTQESGADGVGPGVWRLMSKGRGWTTQNESPFLPTSPHTCVLCPNRFCFSGECWLTQGKFRIIPFKCVSGEEKPIFFYWPSRC